MELAYYGATVHVSSPDGDLPPTHQIFVGREAELGQLRSAFEGVIAGRAWLN